jgi:hypothetical protein
VQVDAIIFDCFGVLYPDTYWTLARKYLGANLSGSESTLRDLVIRVDLGYITRDDLWGEFGDLVGVSKEQVYSDLNNIGGLDYGLLGFIENNKKHTNLG